VAAADRMVGRDIVEGQVGCPVCEAVYPIERGVVRFTRGGDTVEAEPMDAHRLAAMLDLAEPGGAVLLVGSWGAHAESLEAVVETRCLVIDASGKAPVAAQSVRAAATDAPEGVVGAVKPGGRVVAPAARPVPAGVTVLARDDRYWVGEVEAQATRGGVVELRRTRR
jgi:hypothetical protein